MKTNSHTFLHALKLWLIWNVLADLSLAIIIGSGWQLTEHPGGDAHSFYCCLLIYPPLGSPIVGLIQWLAFINRIKHSYMWILTTALGYT